MNNIFPLYETVCIEEVYGTKRPNAHPPATTKTFTFNKIDQCKQPCSKPQSFDWFSKEKVSAFERNSFDFLRLQKEGTPKEGDSVSDEAYLAIRNKIYDLYNETFKFVSLTEAYNEVKGSFRIVSRVHSFLERQKLINNRNVLKECQETIESLSKGQLTNEPLHGAHQDSVTGKTTIRDQPSMDDLNRNCVCNQKALFKGPNEVYLCEDCLDRGRYERPLTTSDFIKINEEVLKKAWSKQEEIRLVEAIDGFGDDWSKVAAHVGSQSVKDCILHFINMPIQEKELSDQNFSIRLPFLKTPNPVMYLITFISSIVHPALGSVATHEALKEIESSQVVIYKKILERTKLKSKDLIDLETNKIKRMDSVIEEAMVNIINYKAKTLVDLSLSENKVREELVNLRTKMMEDAC